MRYVALLGRVDFFLTNICMEEGTSRQRPGKGAIRKKLTITLVLILTKHIESRVDIYL